MEMYNIGETIFLFLECVYIVLSSVTIAFLNVLQIKSKIKEIIEIVFSTINLALVIYITVGEVVTGLTLSMILLCINLVVVILKCRTYLGCYNFKKALASKEVLPFMCLTALYALIILVIFIAGIIIIAVNSKYHLG